MNRTTRERLGAATGILAALSFILGAFFDVGPVPEFGAPGVEIAGWFDEKATNMQVQALLIGLFSALLLWFIGTLRAALRRAEGFDGRLSSIAFGGGVATAGLFLAAGAVTGQAALQEPAAITPENASDLFVLNVAGDGLFGLTTFSRAVLIGAASLVVIRFGGLPKWIGWYGIAVAVLSLTGGFLLLEGTVEGTLGIVWFVALLLFILWLLITSIVLTIRPRTQASEVAP